MKTTFESRAQKRGMSRRAVLAGSGAAGAALALSAVPGAAAVMRKEVPAAFAAVPARRSVPRRATLARFLCDRVHEPMAHELDRIIADPSLDGEATAMALIEARCPGCGKRVDPATRSPGQVVTQWQWADAMEGEVA